MLPYGHSPRRIFPFWLHLYVISQYYRYTFFEISYYIYIYMLESHGSCDYYFRSSLSHLTNFILIYIIGRVVVFIFRKFIFFLPSVLSFDLDWLYNAYTASNLLWYEWLCKPPWFLFFLWPFPPPPDTSFPPRRVNSSKIFLSTWFIQSQPSFILSFHGCPASRRANIYGSLYMLWSWWIHCI